MLSKVALVSEQHMEDGDAFFDCMQHSTSFVVSLVDRHSPNMHTPYMGGIFKDAIVLSSFRNLFRGVGAKLLDDLNRHQVIDVSKTRLLITASSAASIPYYPNLHRYYAVCQKVDLQLRRQVYRSMKKLIPCYDALVSGMDLPRIAASFPAQAFGQEWSLVECRFGPQRVAGQLKEDGMHSFRTYSQGEGYVTDAFEAELESVERGSKVYLSHTPFEDEHRNQHDFGVSFCIVFLLQSLRSGERRAVSVPYDLFVFTLQVRESHLPFLRSIPYRTAARQLTVPSLDLRGWTYFSAKRGEALAGVFYALSHVAERGHTRKALRELDELCHRCAESFPRLPASLHQIEAFAVQLGTERTAVKLPRRAESHPFVRKDGSAVAAVAFVHDFVAVLRMVTDAMMASYVLSERTATVSFIDSLTVENL